MLLNEYLIVCPKTVRGRSEGASFTESNRIRALVPQLSKGSEIRPPPPTWQKPTGAQIDILPIRRPNNRPSCLLPGLYMPYEKKIYAL